MSVLKEFVSQAGGPVAIGKKFRVRYRVEGAIAGQTISVSCDPPYSAGPDIQVSAREGTADIAISGPGGQAIVAVQGELVEIHSFPQDVE
jgi:hypothetical protein